MREHVEIAYPAELESQPFKVGNMDTTVSLGSLGPKPSGAPDG